MFALISAGKTRPQPKVRPIEVADGKRPKEETEDCLRESEAGLIGSTRFAPARAVAGAASCAENATRAVHHGRRRMEAQAAVPVRAVVVAPSFNNAGTLADVLTRLAALGLPILLVNDGCTDSTDEVFKSWQREHPRVDARMLKHRHNRGKAAALKTGFAAATQAGYTHAITIDTDGQHDPERIPALLEKACEQPLAYVLGVRDDRHADYPARSRLGRRLSNLFIRLESGLKVADSQCGLRIYPLDLIKSVPCHAGRFGYEAEMITRAAWAGCPIVEVPINTRYMPAGQRVSHFNPWLDTFLGICLHLRLVAREMTPLPHWQYHEKELPPRKRFSLRDLLRWMNPLRAWRELRGGGADPDEFAAALSTGVFIANLPVYPFQTVLCLYLARRLHLNPLAVLAGSQISTPPITAVLIAAALCAGHLVLHGSLPTWPNFHSAHAIWKSLAWPLMADWAVGGVVVGLVLGAITFVVADWMFGGKDDEAPSAEAEVSEEPPTRAEPSCESARIP